MKILITGNMGYVGPIVQEHLRRVLPQATLLGFDSAYFAGCLIDPLESPQRFLDTQHFGDIRDFPPQLLDGVDAVVHLAAISNDPMGLAFEEVTADVNHRASVSLATLARSKGVNQFVFASSCSVYGTAGSAARAEAAALNPLTAYARSKVATEESLRGLASSSFAVSCLRFATACGFSPRLRLDLVLNDFVASALSTGKIVILSDGTPWRPLIDVRDMARAIEWAVCRSPAATGEYLVVNVGSEGANYQVKDLAHAVCDAVPSTAIEISKTGQPDKRSYRVDFSLYAKLAPTHLPQHDLMRSVEGLVRGLRKAGFANAAFRDSHFIRLLALQRLRERGYLTPDLRWRPHTKD